MSNATAEAEKAMSKAGLQRDGFDQYPFLDFKSKVGNYAVGRIVASRDLKVVIKKGKNKGKPQDTTYFTFEMKSSNIAGQSEGTYTISPTGLLKYQLTEGAAKKSLTIPFDVGITYEGKDDEGRHKTSVFFPKED